VTHDIDEALLLATRIVLLNQGRIEQMGTPLELLQQPANDFVAEFLGRDNLGLQLLALRSIELHIKPIEGLAPTHCMPIQLQCEKQFRSWQRTKLLPCV
jgi:osmoprotectant transport system ATP-binding protein